MKKNIKFFLFGISSLLIVVGFLMVASLAHAVASTITETTPPTELLPSSVFPAKANTVIPIDTFSFVQASGSATLDSLLLLVTDPGGSGLANTDIASISLRKESGATPNFQVDEDLVVTGAVLNNPAIGLPIFLTPTTPEVIGLTPVQYYIVFVVAATPTDNVNFTLNFGAGFGTDNAVATVGSALTATKKVVIDITPPSDPSASDYRFNQAPPGSLDQFAVNSGVSVGTSGNTAKIYTADGLTLLGQGMLGGSPVQFAPVNIGDNTNASVKIEFVDPAGNASNKVLVPAIGTGNDIVSPTAIATAFTDRINIQFSENVDGMMAMNCANYTVGGSPLTCGGFGNPFVDFQGDKATIKGLSLSGTTTLVISSGNTITDINGHNPLTAYSSGSLTVNVLSLPSISSLSSTSGSVGDSITITGTSFGTGTAGDSDHKVFFSGGFNQDTGPLPPVEADYTGASWSSTSITVKVPIGAKGGPVNVMVGGVVSDMNQNSFFDIAANYVTKIYYIYPGTLMLDGDKDNIRIVIDGPRGPVVHFDGDGTTTYNAGTDEFTITGVSSMGHTWAYDVTGDHLNSQGQQVDISTTQNHILKATSRKISGTITLGASCGAGGQNKDVVIFAMPDQVDTGSANFKPMDPAFFKTNGSCVVNYSVGIPMNGTYRVEAHIPPDANSTTVSSSAFIDPSALSVVITDADPTASGKNFTFTTATHKIVGTVVKPSGGFGTEERGMLYVFAYQPRENGKGTGTQVANDGSFTLYVSPGTWKVGVGGPNMPFPVEVQVDVDNTYELADPDKGPTITIAPPADFIEGYVKDSAGNGLANTSLYSWLEGGPGGGNAKTDSQGYYKMYVTPGSNYHIGANSQIYGFLGEQSNIIVSDSVHPTVNFTVSAADNFTITGTVTKGASALQQAFVFITEGEHGQMLGSGGTDGTGIYTVRVSGGSNRWIHVGLPAKGEIYKANLGTVDADRTGITAEDITISSSTITVRISPNTSFEQAFVGVHSDTGGGFSDTDVAVAQAYREYQIDIQRPGSGSTTYYIDGGIPGYGPLPQDSVVVSSGGGFTESSGTPNDGIIEITLGGLYTIDGTVTGVNVKDAWVFASGPNGGSGSPVAENGTYSLQLRDGTYDIGVGKPGYIGNKITTVVSGADVPLQNLTLTAASNTITGTVYLPGGTIAAVNAQVWADNGNGGFAGSSTDASGNYSLSVGDGSWTVKAAYDGYNSNGISVTAPATDKNITLVTVGGFTPNTMNAPLVPSDGGIMSGAGFKVDFPKNALGTGTSAGTIEIKSTTNVITRNDRKLVGTAKEITARNSDNQNVTTLSGSATIELTVSRAELVSSGISFDQVKEIKITYYDSTGGSWVEIPTIVTLSVPDATTILELDADPAITLTGTTTHLSTYSPSLPTDADAPATPTSLTATAGNTNAALTWTASSGATKYDIYKKVGDDYPYLAQTTSTSYTATGLTNGTTYYFKVSALDGSDRESAATSAVTVTPVAPSGGGGGSYTSTPLDTTAPTNTSIIISAGAATASSVNVTLTLAAIDASSMIISNDSSFTGASWESYSTSKAWILTSGDGVKTVYAKFKDVAGNISTSVSDTITLAVGVTPVVPVVQIEGCLSGYKFSSTTGKACIVGATPATPATPAVPGVSSATPATPATPASRSSFNFGTKTLKNGSKGEPVKELQRFLNQVLNLGLVVDGKLGPKTIAVIKKWQKANGLVADGLIGAKTKAKMNLMVQ